MRYLEEFDVLKITLMQKYAIRNEKNTTHKKQKGQYKNCTNFLKKFHDFKKHLMLSL